jgi:hydrogenase maturation protein HypF
MNEPVGEQIRVRGTVQGVGFRPAVWRLAWECELRGQVWNDAEGVLIHAWGSSENLGDFVQRLRNEVPPLANIESLEISGLSASCDKEGFVIVSSQYGNTRTEIVADAAVCPACMDDVSDPENRRYRYPLTNCTHCGPRLSIIRKMPYDRANTSMSEFPMCPACQAEYENPADRRFHAQANACPECGPEIWIEDANGEKLAGDPVSLAAQMIRSGKIVAIKGIGGVHLACDACNEEAVSRLRQRKKRYDKPFALMASDVAQVRGFVSLAEKESEILQSTASPVVVLNQLHGGSVASGVAPRQRTLGFMLPYTPLHHLLMSELDGPIVLTSGNISDEPQCYDNESARQHLNGIADFYLLHNREILNRLDDSVLRVMAGKPVVLRRARGYAPTSIRLPQGFEQADGILAMGGELKNTFCLVKNGQAIISQHMGDLENAEALRDYHSNIDLYRQLYDFEPAIIAVDKHPDYFSARTGRQMAANHQLDLYEVQHHHAHITACMAEHGLVLGERVLGVALDGLGLGEYGALWGGEFLLAGYDSFERVASVQSIAMIGGNRASYEPWRNTYAHLHAINWQRVQNEFVDTDVIRRLKQKPLKTLDSMMEKKLNAPLASSAGRLFDAVAAALGICFESTSYEGQAAIELEAIASQAFDSEKNNAYPVDVNNSNGCTVISWQSMWLALLGDLKTGVAKAVIAARFHHGLAQAIAKQVIAISTQYGVKNIVLSGGVFQNRLLLKALIEALSHQSLNVLYPHTLPANDGGLSLGQAVIAACRYLACLKGDGAQTP